METRTNDSYVFTPSNAGEFTTRVLENVHLSKRYYLLRLQRKPELIAAFRHAIEHRSSRDELLAYRLQAAGLVKREANTVVPRCDLYAKYFRERLRGGR